VSSQRELVKIWNQIAIDNSEKNSCEGEVTKLNDDGSHNVKLTEENGVEYTIQNRLSDDGKSKYPAGTRVILTLPDGSLDRSVIRGNANFNLPSSPTVKHFSTIPATPVKVIYLCYPDENLVRCLNKNGQFITSFSIDNPVNIVNVIETGLYTSSNFEYNINFINHSGEGLMNLANETSSDRVINGLSIDYTNAYLYTGNSLCGEGLMNLANETSLDRAVNGLSIDSTNAYLYTMASSSGSGTEAYISRLEIATKVLEKTWFNMGTGEILDLAHNNNLGIFVLFYASSKKYIRKISFDGSLISNLEVDSTTIRIFSERWYSNIYACNASCVKIYSRDLVLLKTINEPDILNIAVYYNAIYLQKINIIKKYSLNGEYQNQFPIGIGVTDIASI
jgi:hypothetical protein